MATVDVKAGHTHVRQGGKGITYGFQAPLLRTRGREPPGPQGTMPALLLLTSLSTSMPKSGAAQGDTPRWEKTRLCFVVTRSGCGCDRAPAKNEATDADRVPIQWRRLFLALVFVLVLRCIAFLFSCAGPWLTLALTHEKGYKICAKCQTGSAVCTQRLIVHEYLRIISPHHEDARRKSPAW